MALHSSNTTLLIGPDSSSVVVFVMDCFRLPKGFINMTVLTAVGILVLPVHVLILKLAHQRWRQKQSPTATSHFDLVTYHAAVLELVNMVGFVFCSIGVLVHLLYLTLLGVYLLSLKLTGQMLFDILTCVERYLAVVHPVTYLSLRTANGVRVGKVIVGCVWALSVASMGTMAITDELTLILLSTCTLSFSVLLISFCSISALCVLTRPKPGGGAADRQLVDRSKLKAFYTIIFILAMLLLRFGSNLLIIIKEDSLQTTNERCGLWFSVFWFCLPSSLVSPLLLLQKTGKLSFWKKNRNPA